MKRLIALFFILNIVLFAADVWDYSHPNVSYLKRTTNSPLKIHVMIVDLKNPGVQIKNVLAHDTAWDREIVSSMANRVGALGAINGDFCGFTRGIPEGLNIVDGEMVIAPKYRTAIGFTKDNTAEIGMWINAWNWDATISDPDSNTHDIVMMNLDQNTDWMCLYTEKYGRPTPGNSISSNIAEVVIGADSVITEIRSNVSGINISADQLVVSGRESSADWIRTNLSVGEKVHIDLKTDADWKHLYQALSGGPLFVKDGAYFADPKAVFPAGEDFTLSYKNNYYNTKQPRSAAGISRNGDKLIMVVVDGRQSGYSIGVTLQELAGIMIEFGAWKAVQFDSGGSATFYFDGSVKNSPSDGPERAISGALCVLSETNYINILPDAHIIGSSSELSPEFGPATLIDGQREQSSSKWATNPDDSSRWVEFDLRDTVDITHFQLFHGEYTMDPSYLNTREFSIYTRSSTSDNWHEDFHIINSDYHYKDNLCTFDSPKNVRYVRLVINDPNHLDYDNYVRLVEFEAFIEDTSSTSENSIDNANFPDNFKLEQNYPNPFNPATTIAFTVNQGGADALNIYDISGKLVRTWKLTNITAGNHEVLWKGIDQYSNPVGSGIYIYELISGKYSISKKMAFIK